MSWPRRARWVKGEGVWVYSKSQQSWLDGVLEEVAYDNCIMDGYSIPAGALKVVSASGFKWIMRKDIETSVRKLAGGYSQAASQVAPVAPGEHWRRYSGVSCHPNLRRSAVWIESDRESRSRGPMTVKEAQEFCKQVGAIAFTYHPEKRIVWPLRKVSLSRGRQNTPFDLYLATPVSLVPSLARLDSLWCLHRSLWCLRSSELEEKVRNNHDSIERNKAQQQKLLSIIRSNYVEELALQTKAEILSNIIKIASEVEADPEAKGAQIKALSEVARVRPLALESYKTVCEARGAELEEKLYQLLLERLDQVYNDIFPLAQKVMNPGAMKQLAQPALDSTLRDFERIQETKAVYSEPVSDLEEEMKCLRGDGTAIIMCLETLMAFY